MKIGVIVILLALVSSQATYAATGQLDVCSRTGENPLWAFVKNLRYREPENIKINGIQELPVDPLSSAVIFGDKDEIKRLLKNTSYITKYGGDALTTAATMGRIDISLILIQSGVSPNAKNKNGTTAIYGATQYGCSEEIEFLIRHGANVNYRISKTAVTPMLDAVVEHHYLSAATLLDHGYNVSPEELDKIRMILDKDGETSVWDYLFSELPSKRK